MHNPRFTIHVPETPRLGIHHIRIILLVILDDRHLLLAAHFLATHGTGALAAQPRADALQIELVATLARQLNNEAVFILEVGNLANGTIVVLVELLSVHAVERVNELLGDAAQAGGRVVNVVLEGGDEALEELAVVSAGGGGVERLQLVLQETEEGGRVDGGWRGVRVVLGRLVARGFAQLVEEGEEGSHVDAAAGAMGLGEFDIVLDCDAVLDVGGWRLDIGYWTCGVAG